MSVDQTPPAETTGPAPVAPAPSPESIWTTGGPPAAPPPGSSRRRRMLALVMALVVLAGAGIGVAAVLASDSNPSANAGGSPRPSPAQSPSAVVGLEGKAEAFAVTLTWSPATAGAAAEGFAVYRDGVKLTSIASPQTSYTDLAVTPGNTYLYEVEATAAGGTAHSSRISVTVQTPIPTLASARVEGNFNVKVAGQSHSGFTSFVNNYTLGWNFKPKCGSGACSLAWKDLGEKTIGGTLRRAGGTYSGSDSGTFGVKCGSAVVTTTLTVRFHAAKAQGIDGVWRATKIVGTMTESSPSQLGCVASSATYNISATLVR